MMSTNLVEETFAEQQTFEWFREQDLEVASGSEISTIFASPFTRFKTGEEVYD